MRIGSLFSGIGGLELGLEAAGLGPVVWQVEIDPFCREVLAARYPEARRYEDVRAVDASVGEVDVLCGGFPCQDVSLAGPGAGLDGARSGLWFEFRRIVELLRPRVVVVENTPGLVRRGMDIVVGGLRDLGYEVEGTRLRASDLGAPHRRERVFLVGVLADGTGAGRRSDGRATTAGREEGRVADGGDDAGGLALATRKRFPFPRPVWFGGGYAAAVGGREGEWLTPEAWTTPTARDTRSCHTGTQGNTRPLSEQVGERGVTGPLNPAWVETLMGLPMWWTDPTVAIDAARWWEATGGRAWPMGRGPDQHPWEPPRMVPARSVPNRSARVKALGNAVVPACAYVVGCRVRERLHD